jgi:hypothetical protein
MSDKQKKFVPSAGYIVSVHQNALGIRAVAQALDIFPEALAQALEKSGFQVVADPFDLSADAGKLIQMQARQEAQGLHVVKESDNDTGSNTSTD